ncbi:MAG: DMT family transporter [Gammaproteobacteria bacterium]|nr:DMT family transporter [Gammaproteobacteria bacterium]
MKLPFTKSKQLTPMAANFAMLTAAAIWGSTFLVIKESLVNMHAVTLVCYRFALAALFMGVVLSFLQKKHWKNPKEGLILGLLLFAAYVTQAIAMYYMEVVNAGFIAGLFVIFVPILSFISGREKLRLNIAGAVVLAGVGLWVITGGISSLKWGDYLMLFSAVVFATHVLYADSVVKKVDILVLNFQQFLVVTTASFLVILFFKLPFVVSNWHAVWGVLYLALFANVLGYMVQLSVQKTISPTIFALILSLEPVSAAIFAWTIGGEKITILDIIGGLMIISAIIFAQVYRKDKVVPLVL